MPGTDDRYGPDPQIPVHISIAIAVFIAIALYNFIELNVLIFGTFKIRRGLYFWSLVVATWGVALWSLGYLVKNFRLADAPLVYCLLIPPGWCAMVTGQSLVLYSRLHLLLYNRTHLRLVLGMIIFDALVLHIPTIVIAVGATSSRTGIVMWIGLYQVYEKIHVTVFFVQELLISSIYITASVGYFRLGSTLGKKTGSTMRRLILVNAMVIALDITILVLEFMGHYEIQTAYKGMAYSIKLKVEFGILNDLVRNAKSVSCLNYHSGSHSCSPSPETPLQPTDFRLTACDTIN